MSDLLFVIIVVAFFALAAGAVRLCESVVGRTDQPGPDVTSGPSAAEASAPAPQPVPLP